MVESEAGGETEATGEAISARRIARRAQAENQTMAPIHRRSARRSVTILGKVIGLLRGF